MGCFNHLDLFSGIGGFAYAVDQVWPNANHIFCDNNKFCQQVIKKHWPNARIYGDIKEITADTEGDYVGHRQREEQQERENTPSRSGEVDLVTGGFPCQPFSQAGKRKGTDDDRYLWPEMLRVIRLTKPQWVIAENVRGLLTLEGGLVFEQVCLDLEASDYEVQPFIIPAVAVNAPHRRDRVWFIAHRTGERSDNRKRDGEERHILRNENWDASESKSKRNRRERGTSKIDKSIKDSLCERGSRGSKDSRQMLERQSTEAEVERPDSDTRNTNSKGLARREQLRQSTGKWFNGSASWERSWLEVATELCGMDDGLPAKLDGFELSKSKHRIERLKSLGNSIVPQVAIEIMKAIKSKKLGE
jgi:DNA (cytosine-5)-methyltransferase 1